MSQVSAAHREPQQLRHCSQCLAIYRSDFTRCPVDGAHIVTASADPMLGVTVAEHYQIDELIGIGSSGRVYVAHHSRLAQRRFALKVLFGDLAATASARMRFTHEAESASRLAHPNLVSVVDFGRTPAGLLYLAMDFIEGPTLASLIAQGGAMPQERAVRIALQLCRGLAHAHDLGLIHRDFKPDNILVSTDAHGDVPRIVDFGIALSADVDGDPRLTATGVTLGTPAYAAPEQTADGDVDLRADLFALGVTMYEMLTGRLPFDGSMVDMMRQNATENPPPMVERAPGVHVTPALQQVVSKLMARDPAARYQTAREALDALAELPRRSGAAARPSTTAIPVPVSLRTASTPIPVGPHHITPPPMGAAAPMTARRSSPMVARESSPVIPHRASTPALPYRASSPSMPPYRASSPAINARQSSPVLAGRASAPTITPLVLPSSSAPRASVGPVEAPEPTGRVGRIELAPLVAAPLTPRGPRWVSMVLAVSIAAVVSAASVIGYQRLTRKRALPAGAAVPVVAPASTPLPSPPPSSPSPAAAQPEPTAPVASPPPVEDGVPPAAVPATSRDEARVPTEPHVAPADDTVIGAPTSRPASNGRRRPRSVR
jgi:eukaryotic-like serine/threonine-protein kinase